LILYLKNSLNFHSLKKVQKLLVISFRLMLRAFSIYEI